MMAKTNDGTQLEDLVKLIETIRSPPGFSVESRRKVFNDEGVQVAELDITISGKIGTSAWTMLIECRDRPSEGAAPVSWIEQMVGRRDRLSLDKILAVSSTGFSPAAIDYANQKNIELRTLRTLTYEDVAACVPFYAPLVFNKFNLLDVQMQIASPDLPEELAGCARLSMDERFVIDNATNDRLTMLEVFNRLNGDGKYFADIVPNSQWQRKKVVVNEAALSSYSVERDGYRFHFLSVEFDVEFAIERSMMPLVQAATYVDDDKRLCDAFRWVGQPKD
jgi:hypothetical protein